ncbi:hypothetical protein HZC20_02490 [Candidatus Peregrinibacteria bacterium]|nr:hypothetical protein [Candidatus Peregrinibacteria bacterium]
MAKLKIDLKKKSSKKVFSKKEIKSSLYHGRGFLGIIVIFAGVSLYAMVSFFSSTNKFIDRYYVDVTGTEGSVSIAPEKPAEKIFNDVDENYQH